VSTAHTTAYLLKTHNIFGLVQINSKGFWRWCTALERIMFLDFVHLLMFS
jgi:hypothetical protein